MCARFASAVVAWTAFVAVGLTGSLLCGQEAPEEATLAGAQHVVAVEHVCAWPNLTRMPDGSLVAIIHNQPSHGQREGELECWASANGEQWEKRGNPAPHQPHTVRMNHAAGLAKNGDLLVLCSGWTDVKQPERPKQAAFRDDILSSWTCRSSDGGRTWTHHEDFPSPEQGWSHYIPFGDIIVATDGALHVSVYQGNFADPSKSTKIKAFRSWHFRSDDDGKTWQRGSLIGARHNETALFHAGGKRWIAAARIDAMELFPSTDDGKTWGEPSRVTSRNQINGHLVRLKDGRLVLAYGNRVKGQFGVMAKVSDDDGASWGPAIRLAHTLDVDCGYPSSVQRDDGRIVTAYYAKASERCDHYHMGVVIWDADKSK
ncbi:MAG: exo-alpha-sialidase [Planctomycetales bacterium]|nr:exo-alpha-sialidase [Planctomycetales bacterium]